MPVLVNSSVKYTKNIHQAPKRVFPEEPTNFNHKREVVSQLSAEELSTIEVGTNAVNFGQVYIKSKESRYCWVKNGTKKAISICLKVNDNELSQSFKKNQVIPGGNEAGFQLAFCKDTLGDFKTSLKYIINNIH